MLNIIIKAIVVMRIPLHPLSIKEAAGATQEKEAKLINNLITKQTKKGIVG